MPKMKRYAGTDGGTILVDISKRTCKKFGFFHGQRINSPYGKGVVIGVNRGNRWYKKTLWFLFDGDSGISYIRKGNGGVLRSEKDIKEVRMSAD